MTPERKALRSAILSLIYHGQGVFAINSPEMRDIIAFSNKEPFASILIEGSISDKARMNNTDKTP